MKKLAILFMLIIFCGCSNSKQPATQQSAESAMSPQEKYVNESGEALADRFYTPVGAVRSDEPLGSLGSYTRVQTLKAPGEALMLYTGEMKPDQGGHAAVFAYQIANDNKQQSAGSVMRIWSEFLFASARYKDISFMLTNGIEFKYDQWREGYRPDFRTEPKMVKRAEAKTDYESFFNYFVSLMQFSDIQSLEGELGAVELNDMRIGDVFITSEDGGHAAMVVDMCATPEGQKYFILAGGGSPAQDIHVFRNLAEPELYVWYTLPGAEQPIETPEYTFPANSLKRFTDL